MKIVRKKKKKKIDFADEIEEKDKSFKLNKISEKFDINSYVNEI